MIAFTLKKRLKLNSSAADRFAEGTYTVLGNKIILKSNKEPGKDFTVAKQHSDTNGFIIKVIDPNISMAKYVQAIVIRGNEKKIFEPDDAGIIVINLLHPGKIYLQHRFFSDIFSLIKEETNPNNYFEVTLNPSLQQVCFKGIDLTISGTKLTWLPNYFMPEENVYFEKE